MTTNEWTYAEKELPPEGQKVDVRILTEAKGTRTSDTTFNVDESQNNKSTVIQWKYEDNVSEDIKLQGPEQE